MSSFHNFKEIVNLKVKSKVMASRNVLMCFARFLDISTILTPISTCE